MSRAPVNLTGGPSFDKFAIRQRGFALPHTLFSAPRAGASRALRIGDVSHMTIPKNPKTTDRKGTSLA